MAKNVKKAAAVQPAVVDVVKNEVLTYESIVDSFKARVAKAKAPVDARIAAQVKLNGSVDGTLYVLVANGIAVVEPFDYRGADIEIDADADVFAAVLAGKKAMSSAIVDGDVKMQGNAGKAIVLASVVF
ncbi:MAG: SCP2 sterol-binding domain-containing protein [Oscillospiraceae bacterium]|nr:SCP2 sterol-binding domain-containing protein [Oscillospiraceae bacterium]MDY6207551.1 SCP2 sterol-binding domain-containing protein [Oscillospiraceae bacterium]